MNLFWKSTKAVYQPCQLAPFSHEEALENLIFHTEGILGTIFPLHRQIQGGNKPGIPDILGIDDEGNVCIIELKNVRVDSSILPQVLQYAIWAETNPDSIKNLWLTAKNQPEGLNPTFEDYAVRIIVIAPNIDPSVVYHMDKIKMNVDLIEINRYRVENHDILSVNHLEPVSTPKRRPVSPMGDYDLSFYERNYNAKSAGSFFDYIQRTVQFIEEQGWPLELKLNKDYAVFKIGFRQVFGITWLNSKSFAYFFKLTKDEAELYTPSGVNLYKYEDGWKYASYKIEAGKTSVEDFLPLMKASVEKLLR